MYSVKLSNLAKKQLKKLDKKLQSQIVASLERCRFRPYVYVKKLVNNPYFSLRVGDYRVIMDIRDDQLRILVIKIDHRKKIYKK